MNFKMAKTVYESTHVFRDPKNVGATTYMSILPRWGAIGQNTFCMAAILKSEMAATKTIFTHPYFPSPTQLLAYPIVIAFESSRLYTLEPERLESQPQTQFWPSTTKLD